MSCQYQNNDLCSQLPAAEREALCRHCRIKTYERGRRITGRHWGEDLVICLDGLIMTGRVDPNRRNLVTNGIISANALIAVGSYYGEPSCELAEWGMQCIMDSTVMIIDAEFMKLMFDRSIGFVKLVYRLGVRDCLYGLLEVLDYIGNGDAYDAVRYVCLYCKRHKIPPLTHEQIALICNRSRPTVTEIMHKLAMNEPELFA